MKYSIQNKILLWFSIIIFIGLSSIIFASYKITEQNTERIIQNDMITVKKNLDLYLKQYSLIRNIEYNETKFLDIADDVSKELSSEVGSNVDIYNASGEKISNFLTQDKLKSDDISKAIKGEIAYSINYSGGKVIVSLSYPIEKDNKAIGIIRYTKDYSELYAYNSRFKNIINIFAGIIFIIVFIASIIISKQIAKPIIELTKSSEEVSKGNFDINININSRDEIGELSKRFKIMIDRIKEQINIIKKERDNLKEAQRQNKTFFDNVTHELKTPLTTILGYAQIIKENEFTDKEFFDKGTSYIINESKRLNDMVVEILELSTTTSKEMIYDFERVDLSKSIKNTCEEMNIKARKYNINVVAHVEENLIINGDSSKVKEVFVNLIDNSIKYGNVNSIIVVEAKHKENDIYISLRDSGEGISEEHINNLFEPFYRISKKKSREKGSAGLGLSIVKNIVENHGGSIKINSEVGIGTEVIIILKGEINE
ncbi:HAMP domain-containing sensor histidine kinase [Clostridium sp. 'White wine YQ']|uniref:HAMP domain-containing sensor histidine kinase n=1 Tax=Clostridium sp. 'White wine YQ' TaxID=3027474 RepID=UPI0023660824|nr:HAMP domain-containing sensor histidine kinase [Clostridium sp. 'White wine YQ']MDD7793592.1 HAMP domain-containing sensor histidine kinase [Clostridium sp. 'White wine YQ']